MIKKLRPFYPALAVTCIGLAVACLLGVLTFEYITADKPAAHLAPKSTNPATQKETPATATVSNADVATVPQPTPQTTTTAPTAKPKSKPQPTSVATPVTTTPATYPSTTTGTSEASITISNGGCTITAVGAPGMALRIAAHNTSKGGQTEYTIPASGKITVPPGGTVFGMDIDAWLITPNGIPGTQYGPGSVMVYAGDSITNAAGC